MPTLFRLTSDVSILWKRTIASNRDANPTSTAVGLVSRVPPVHTAVRNCIRDGGGPSGFGDQEPIPSHRERLWSKAKVVSVAETSGP